MVKFAIRNIVNIIMIRQNQTKVLYKSIKNKNAFINETINLTMELIPR